MTGTEGRRFEGESLSNDIQRTAAEYWESFKKQSADPELEKRILDFLDKNKASFLDFYLAARFSNSPSADYILSCILLMKQTFSETKLYAASFDVWKILFEHVIYEYPDGVLSLHKPHSMNTEGKITTQFNNISITGSKAFVAKALAMLSHVRATNSKRLEEIEKRRAGISEGSPPGNLSLSDLQ